MNEETSMKAMMKRMKDLEERIETLEKRMRFVIWSPEISEREKRLVEQYGESVDKTVAAKILGVTRATVYAMLADGRISPACEGKRVNTQSIASYMDRPVEPQRGRKKKEMDA